jgi:hypothetical protein
MTRVVSILLALHTLGAGYKPFYGLAAHDMGIERRDRQRSGGNVVIGGGKRSNP